MSPKEQAVSEFYKAFNELDAEKMVSLYHSQVEFTDPAFGTLKGEHAGNMWRMLCKNARDFSVECSGIKEDGNRVETKWEAHYTFSRSGRRVHNIIHASFEFEGDKVIRHIDQFNLHRWAKQALGFKGFLFGGTSFFQKGLQKQTHQLLTKFEQELKS